jgi:hypothetical protein
MRPQSIVLVAGWWVGAILAGTGNVTNFPADWGPIHIAALIILTVAASLVADGVLGTRFDPVIAGYAHEHVGLAAVFDFILGAITALCGSASVFVALRCDADISHLSLSLCAVITPSLGIAYAAAANRERRL